ncbi:MAG: ABC transporter permease [Acidimicrobiia bacterium]
MGTFTILAIQFDTFSIIEGAIQGLLYGLLALGLVLLYRTSRVVNFAHGQLGVVLAVFMLKLTDELDIPYLPSLLVCLALAAGLGAVCEVSLRRLFKRPRVLMMVATIGLAEVLYLVSVLRIFSPKETNIPFPVPIDTEIHIAGGILPPAEVLTLIVAPLVALALALFLRYSPWGLGMRAMAENTDSARLSGVWVKRMSTLAWAIAGLLSAITAILNSPGRTSTLSEALPPGVLLRALAAALIASMASYTIAFAAGIMIGILEQIATFNLVTDLHSTAYITLGLFLLILLALAVRVGRLRRDPRTEERSSWVIGGESSRARVDSTRRWVGRSGVALVFAIAVGLPFIVSEGRSLTLSQVYIYAVIALSMVVLTGWAGQVSLGQFGLVAVGAIVAARLPDWPLIPLLLTAGLITSVVAVVVGLPALRIRGVYLAVTTLGFALFMQVTVLPTPCWKLPFTDTEVCTGLPDQFSTLLDRPRLFGLALTNTRDYALFSLGVLIVTLLIVRTWRDRGIARRLVAVRDNEVAAAAMGIPVVRTKLLAFALSGFLAGVAGVCFAFAQERISPGETFGPKESILVLSMAVVGGLGSVPGAVLAAVYLVGLPFVLGSTGTVQFITSGFGVLAFLLYLPGGLGALASRAGDGVTLLIQRRRGRGAPDDAEPEASGRDAPQYAGAGAPVGGGDT